MKMRRLKKDKIYLIYDPICTEYQYAIARYTGVKRGKFHVTELVDPVEGNFTGHNPSKIIGWMTSEYFYAAEYEKLSEEAKFSKKFWEIYSKNATVVNLNKFDLNQLCAVFKSGDKESQAYFVEIIKNSK